jgi:predicted RNA-binding Zn-ribbon protein involved in translation (DUF1610 family)
MTTDGNDPDDESVTVERLPPEEAFGVLGHEIRVGILEALNAAGGTVPFSELRKRVGVADAGKFNYHLSELTGRFVRKTERGYRLAAAGKRVVGAVLSGGITKDVADTTVATDAPCPQCGRHMDARLHEDGIAVECPDCGSQYTDPDVPAGVVEGRPSSVATAVDLWTRRKQVSAGYGFCHYCDGPVERAACLPGDPAAPEWFDERVDADWAAALVVYECDRCGEWWHAIPSIAVQSHPAVMGFHYEHGYDLRETPAWELPWMDHGLAAVVGEDPLRIEVPVELDGERLVLTLDRDATAVDTRREAVDG